MKKTAYIILAVFLILSFSSISNANSSSSFELIGREIFAGFDFGDRVVGALFIGKFFNSELTAELGRFTVILDHDNKGVEECVDGDGDGGRTELQRFKLIMNFHSGARLVLIGPRHGDVYAEWEWDDPECLNGNCPLIDAEDYLYYIYLFRDSELVDCKGDNPVNNDPKYAYIAEVQGFRLARQWLGSYGTRFKGGLVSGYLVHTPIISPAIFGTLELNE